MKTDNKWKSREALTLERVITSWQESEEAGSRKARGDLATVRRLYGKSPEDDPLATAEAMSLLFKAGLRSDHEEVYSIDGLTDGERAAVVTLALYAGVGRNIKHEDGGFSVGSAMGVIRRQTTASNNNKDNGDMLSVMKSIVSAQDFRSIVWDVSRALRRLDGITVDYIQLAEDLTRIQTENNRLKVLLSWTGDYWSEALDFDNHSKNNNDDNEEE